MFDRWTRRTTAPRTTTRLRAEALEDRWVPATLIVDDNPHPGAFTSIQAAVNAAHSGDTIRVFPGTYTVGSASLVKTIYKPKAGTLRVSVNGVEELAGWTMNASTGVISRSVGLAGGETIRAGFD